MSDKWLAYHEVTKHNPPSDYLVHALEYIPDSSNLYALDLGSGACSASKYLAQFDIKVIAVDKSPNLLTIVEEINLPNIIPVVCSFNSFSFPYNTYDLVNFEYALPFAGPQEFNEIFCRMVQSVRPGGIITGNLFGFRDEWNTEGRNIAFHMEEDIINLLEDMKILYFEEQEYDGQNYKGEPKHWHVFNFIARKPS